MSSPDPVPSYFGLRYLLWLAWSNIITLMMTVQAVFTMITLDPTLVSHNAFHYVTLGNAVLCVVIAQIKKNSPPSPHRLEDRRHE